MKNPVEPADSRWTVDAAWTEWNEIALPRPPFHFLQGVPNERIRRLMTSVWRRLPDYDRLALEELVSSVGFYPDLGGDHTLASAAPADPDSAVDGIAAQVVEGLSAVVNLSRATEVRSDLACMYLIAHEFAHVILRHHQISTLVVVLAPTGEPYERKEIACLKQWQEDEADLQAWAWGFREGLSALLDEFPRSRRPRWYVELSHGPDSPSTT